MENCFVYLRKSTKRYDKQQNTLDIQAEWVNSIFLDHPDYQVIWLDWHISDIPADGFIYESESAKQWWKPRPEFHKMLDAIKKYECDYIVVWKPDRISRNSDDMVAFTKLFEWKEKKVHKAIITDRHTYDVNISIDINNLERALTDAKTDNVNRAETAINIQRYLKQKGVYPHKFPFWYIPTRLGAGVEIDPAKQLLVELAFQWRVKWYQWKKIADHFVKEGFPANGDKIKKMLSNPIYIGRFYFEWQTIAVKNEGYKVMIDAPLFHSVQEYNEKHKWTHWKVNPDSWKWEKNNRYFRKMVFDANGITLQAYENRKTGIIYYHQPSKHYTYIINISEQKLFQAAERQIEQFRFPNEIITLIREELKSKLYGVQLEADATVRDIKSERTELKNKIMDNARYLSTIKDERTRNRAETVASQMEDELELLEEELKKAEASNINTGAMAEKYSKYFEDLPATYKKVSKSEKADVLRGLWVYFIIWPDGHITVAGGDIKNLFSSFLPKNDNE